MSDICDFPCIVCNPEFFDENGDELPREEIHRIIWEDE